MRSYHQFGQQVWAHAVNVPADLFEYIEIGGPFRVQVAHILTNALGGSVAHRPRLSSSREEQLAWHWAERYPHPFWKSLRSVIESEFATRFGGGPYQTEEAEAKAYFSELANQPQALYLVERAFELLERQMRPLHDEAPRLRERLLHPDHAIRELNQRFEENGLGYRYEGGQIVLIASEYLHAEAAVPALRLVRDSRFAGPDEEFLRAHEHLRAGRNKEAIASANAAFESTMKAICEERGWSYDPKAAAKQLVAVLLANGLFPSWSSDYLNGLEKVFLTLPTVRNKTSGHGQGAEVVEVPRHFASYALHTLAANIVFLIESHRALGPAAVAPGSRP